MMLFEIALLFLLFAIGLFLVLLGYGLDAFIDS